MGLARPCLLRMRRTDGGRRSRSAKSVADRRKCGVPASAAGAVRTGVRVAAGLLGAAGLPDRYRAVQRRGGHGAAAHAAGGRTGYVRGARSVPHRPARPAAVRCAAAAHGVPAHQGHGIAAGHRRMVGRGAGRCGAGTHGV